MSVAAKYELAHVGSGNRESEYGLYQVRGRSVFSVRPGVALNFSWQISQAVLIYWCALFRNAGEDWQKETFGSSVTKCEQDTRLFFPYVADTPSTYILSVFGGWQFGP